MTTDATYDVYEHETGSKIADNVGLEGAALVAYLDCYDVSWAVEEYGRCDAELPDEGLGEAGVVVVPAGQPYPGHPTKGPWAIAQYDRDGLVEHLFGPFDDIDKATLRISQLADKRLATYAEGEATIDAYDSGSGNYTAMIVPIGSEGEVEDSWHSWTLWPLRK